MTDTLNPAAADDLAATLAHALQFNGRKRYHQADSFMAQFVAEHLVRQPEISGYVVMKKPPAPWHSTPPTGLKRSAEG